MSTTAPLQAAAQPTKGDSQLLKNNWMEMITAMTFDTSWLAGEMNRAGLLSDNDHQGVTKVKNMLNDTEKAEIMLTSLKKKVELNSKHLSTFLDILNLNSRLYSDTIDILKGGHSTASGNQQPASATSVSTSAISLSNPATPAQGASGGESGATNSDTLGAGSNIVNNGIFKAAVAGTRTVLTYKDYSKIVQQLIQVKKDWEGIANVLEFQPNEVADIRSKVGRAIDGNYIFDVIEFWLRWAPGDGRGSTDVATLEVLQEALNTTTNATIKLEVKRI